MLPIPTLPHPSPGAPATIKVCAEVARIVPPFAASFGPDEASDAWWTGFRLGRDGYDVDPGTYYRPWLRLMFKDGLDAGWKSRERQEAQEHESTTHDKVTFLELEVY